MDSEEPSSDSTGARPTPEYMPSRPPSYRTVASTSQPATQSQAQDLTAAAMPNVLSVPNSGVGVKPVAAEFHLIVDMSFRGRKSVTFMLPDRETPAYFVDYRASTAEKSKADLVVHRGDSSGTVVGMVYFHSYWSPTELIFAHDHVVEMSKDGMFTRRHVVTLPAGPEQGPYYWKGTSDYGGSILMGGNLKLEAASGTVFAAFIRKRGHDTDGDLNILVDGLEPEFLDEIVVSLIAMSEEERRRKRTGTAVGGGLGGGG